MESCLLFNHYSTGTYWRYIRSSTNRVNMLVNIVTNMLARFILCDSSLSNMLEVEKCW